MSLEENGPTEALLTTAQRLKMLTMAYATGQPADATEYSQMRSALVGVFGGNKLLPEFLKYTQTLGEFWPFIKEKFSSYQERRAYLSAQFAPLISHLENTSASPSDDNVTAALPSLSTTYVTDVWRRALARRSTDPEGAITLARSLVETVCKLILDELQEPYVPTAKLPTLYHTVAKALSLAPGQAADDNLKKVFGSCQAIVDGLANLRNDLGDSHGKDSAFIPPEPRHAELTVGLAGAISAFLVQTYEQQKPATAHRIHSPTL